MSTQSALAISSSVASIAFKGVPLIVTDET